MAKSLSITDASEWDVPEGQQYDPVHVQSNPAAFGAGVAQGEERAAQGLDRFGQGVTNALDYYNNVAAQDQVNKYTKAETDALYGDGTAANPGFYGLRGSNAMGAYAGVRQRLDDTRNQLASTLSGPAKLAFDRDTRSQMDRSLRTMGIHYTQQMEQYGDQTAEDTIAAGARKVGLQWNDDQTFADAMTAAGRQVDTIRGQKGWSQEQADEALAKAHNQIVQARVFGMAPTDPDGARKFLDKSFKSGLVDSHAYAELDGHLRAQADEQNGLAASKDAMGQAAKAGPKTVDVSDSAATIKHFENPQGPWLTPHWDSNHWRIGYSSDTVTHADGTIEEVTPFTKIAPEDAERDLQRRSRVSELQVETAIGPKAWDNLPASSRASLASVVYNYGHFPSQLIGPAQSGDPAALADAVRSLSSNPGRRQEEANIILGKFSPAGVVATRAAASPAAVMPAVAEGEAPASSIPPAVPAGAPQVTPAVATTSETPMSPETAATVQPASAESAAFTPAAQTPIEFRANAIRAIEARTDLSDRAKQIAVRNVNETFTAAQIAAEQDAKAKQAQKDASMETYYGFANRGEYAQGFSALNQDPTLTEKEKDEISRMLTSRSGEENPRDHGPNFTDFRRRLLLPYGDPNRISNFDQILSAENDGVLTSKDGDKLFADMQRLKKEDEQGVVARQNGIMQQVHQAFIHDLDIGPVKIADQKGLEHYNQFLSVFLPEYEKWREAGSDPNKFPLFDQKSIKEVMESIYPAKQRNADRMNMGAEAAGQQAAAGIEPAAPQGVNSDRWSVVMAQRPAGAKGQVPADDWARMVGQLAADPKRMAPIWDQSQFGRAGLKAAAVLDQLGVEMTPGKPENVGNEPPELTSAPAKAEEKPKSVYQQEWEESAPGREDNLRAVRDFVPNLLQATQPHFSKSVDIMAAREKKLRGEALTPDEAAALETERKNAR